MHKIVILLLLFILISCGAALYIPDQIDANHSGISLDTLKEGRVLYVKNCAACHNLRLPERFTREEWDTIIPRMQIKAKLNDRQAGLIKKFIEARSK